MSEVSVHRHVNCRVNKGCRCSMGTRIMSSVCMVGNRWNIGNLFLTSLEWSPVGRIWGIGCLYWRLWLDQCFVTFSRCRSIMSIPNWYIHCVLSHHATIRGVLYLTIYGGSSLIFFLKSYTHWNSSGDFIYVI